MDKTLQALPVAGKHFRFIEEVTIRDNFFEIVRHPSVKVHLPRPNNGCDYCERLRDILVQQYPPPFVRVASKARTDHHQHRKHSLRVETSGPAGPLLHDIVLPEKNTDLAVGNCLRRLFTCGTFEPRPHQESVAQAHAANLPKGVLLGYSLGSGKTDGALHIGDRAGATHVDIVCANTPMGQWRQALGQHYSASTVTFRIFGYQRFESLAYDNPKLCKGHLVIVDEAHRYKNLKPTQVATLDALRASRCLLFLTGTPLRNGARDFDLVLLLTGNGALIPEHLEDDPGADVAQYADRTWMRKAREALVGLVAMYDPQLNESSEFVKAHWPQSCETVVHHHLLWPQVFELLFYCQGPSIRINGHGASVGGKSGNWVRMSAMNALRDATSGHIYSSKCTAVVENVVRVGRFPQVVFSRFKRDLLAPLLEALEEELGRKASCSVRMLTGSTPQSQRQKVLDDYNAGRLGVLLLCCVGGEALNLTRGAAALHLLEPLNNTPEEQQVIGRVIRYQEAKRDPTEPPVQVLRYVGQWPADLQHHAGTAARETILDYANAHSTLCRAFTGTNTGPIPYADLHDWMVGQITTVFHGRTAEEDAFHANIQKQKDIQPLLSLLWNASTVAPTVPPKFEDEWQIAMGAKPEVVAQLRKRTEEAEMKAEHEKSARLLGEKQAVELKAEARRLRALEIVQEKEVKSERAVKRKERSEEIALEKAAKSHRAAKRKERSVEIVAEKAAKEERKRRKLEEDEKKKKKIKSANAK